jgi:hypothetical protein
VSKNTALTYLDCGGSELTSLDVSKNMALTYLDCGENELTNLDVSKNTTLTHLYCSNYYSDNKLTNLDVSKNTALIKLNCMSNQLDATALNALFRTLHNNTVSDSKIIYILDNIGAYDCDRSLAENKGWTVW